MYVNVLKISIQQIKIQNLPESQLRLRHYSIKRYIALAKENQY